MSKLINPTRMELTRTKRRLVTALRGHKLLKDKQDEMARQFMNYIKQNMELRKKVEQKLSGSMNEIALASARMGDKNVEEALMVPVCYVDIKPSTKNIMSVNVPVLNFDKSDKNLNLPYSFIFSSSQLDKAVLSFGDIIEDLLILAQIEKTCDMLSDEMEKTRRRVNALEHVIIPEMKRNIKYITMKLDDYERSNITRLMKVKEMVIKR